MMYTWTSHSTLNEKRPLYGEVNQSGGIKRDSKENKRDFKSEGRNG
jgi:hypothetical protein